VPILLAQRRFPGLAISNAKILIYFSYKYTEAVLSNTALGNCYGLKLPKMLITVSEKKIILSFIIIFGTLPFPIVTCCLATEYHSVFIAR